jgi:hypothetical protein
MRRKTSALLLGLLLAGGCSDDVSNKRKLCEALAITAGALSDESLKHASEEYAAANRAMQKWEQWDAKLVPPEQDKAGKYSGAWQRAQTYARAGTAFCDAARVGVWELQQLARLTGDRNVIDSLSHVTGNIACEFGAPTEGSTERKAFLAEWEHRRSEVVAAAQDAVEACFKEFGGTPPPVHTPAIWAPME